MSIKTPSTVRAEFKTQAIIKTSSSLIEAAEGILNNKSFEKGQVFTMDILGARENHHTQVRLLDGQFEDGTCFFELPENILKVV